MAIAGCVLAMLCQRYGLFRPLFISLIVMAMTAVMPSAGITDFSLLISVFIFMAIVALGLYFGVFLYMHRRSSLLGEAA